MTEATHVSKCLRGICDARGIDADEFIEAYDTRAYNAHSREQVRQIIEGKSRDFESNFPIEAALAANLSEEDMLKILRAMFNDTDELISECQALGVPPLDPETQTFREPRRL
jgi:protein-disulfide isomerase-like protein with CxxC motif